MKISSLEEYGIRCLAQLARSQRKLTIGEIAAAEGLSLENAAKILARLRAIGLVTSLRGKEGGYLLARSPERIAVAEIIEGMNGAVFEFERCKSGAAGAGCVHDAGCGLRPVWAHLGSLIHNFLSSVTLADVVARSEAHVDDRVRRIVGELAGETTLQPGRRLPAVAPPVPAAESR
jgi:Rrf2 family iron-sulfur cluster assembly transcriptional regulator